MINIAIVEDEKNISQELKNYVKEIFEKNNFDICISCFENAKSFIDQFSSNYDLIFMDINMPIMDGMTAAREIRKTDDKVMIVFVTSLAQYAIKGYEVNAFDFILKPVAYYNFAMKLTRALDKLSKEDAKTLVINNKSSIKKIKVRKIYYIEVNEHKLIFHTIEGNFTTYGTLKTYLEILKNDSFALCNQCYFVNLKYVTEVKDNIVRVGNDDLQISRPKRKDFIHALNLYSSTGGGSN